MFEYSEKQTPVNEVVTNSSPARTISENNTELSRDELMMRAKKDYDLALSGYQRLRQVVGVAGGELAQNLVDSFYLKDERVALERDYQLLLNFKQTDADVVNKSLGRENRDSDDNLNTLMIKFKSSSDNLIKEQAAQTNLLLTAVNTVAVVGVSLASAGTATPFMLGVYAGTTGVVTGSLGKTILLGDNYTFEQFIQEDLTTGLIDGVFGGFGNVVGVKTVINPIAQKMMAKGLVNLGAKEVSKEVLENRAMQLARQYVSGNFRLELSENLIQTMASEIPAGVVHAGIVGFRMFQEGKDLNQILDMGTQLVATRLVFGTVTATGFTALPYGVKIPAQLFRQTKDQLADVARNTALRIESGINGLIDNITMPPRYQLAFAGVSDVASPILPTTANKSHAVFMTATDAADGVPVGSKGLRIELPDDYAMSSNTPLVYRLTTNDPDFQGQKFGTYDLAQLPPNGVTEVELEGLSSTIARLADVSNVDDRNLISDDDLNRLIENSFQGDYILLILQENAMQLLKRRGNLERLRAAYQSQTSHSSSLNETWPVLRAAEILGVKPYSVKLDTNR